MCVSLSVRIMNSPRCCPPLICGRKAQLGQKAEGEGEGYRGKTGLKEPLQKQVTCWSFSPRPLRREAFRVKPTGRKSRGLLRSKACWDQSRIHLLPDQLLPFSLSVRFLFWPSIFILLAPFPPEAIWDIASYILLSVLETKHNLNRRMDYFCKLNTILRVYFFCFQGTKVAFDQRKA